jgi:hypothetical protein
LRKGSCEGRKKEEVRENCVMGALWFLTVKNNCSLIKSMIMRWKMYVVLFWWGKLM